MYAFVTGWKLNICSIIFEIIRSLITGLSNPSPKLSKPSLLWDDTHRDVPLRRFTPTITESITCTSTKLMNLLSSLLLVLCLLSYHLVLLHLLHLLVHPPKIILVHSLFPSVILMTSLIFLLLFLTLVEPLILLIILPLEVIWSKAKPPRISSL